MCSFCAAACHTVPLISLGLYSHLASSVRRPANCASQSASPNPSVCVGRCAAHVPAAIGVSDYFLRRIATYMTLRFFSRCRFEVLERGFFCVTYCKDCLCVCACVRVCLPACIISSCVYFAARRALCLWGLQKVGAQAS